MDKHHSETEKEKNQPAGETAEFVPPRHWIGPEELEESYWKDPQVQEKRAQEFYEKPVEWLEKIEKIDQKGLVRRDFLTIMGASMAMTGFACARRPVHKIIPYVVKPEEVTPGVPTWYASTCRECSVGCGILAKDREGRPIKVEGNPDHPMNQGALCARGQASILNLYDPDRLKAPVLADRASGSRKEADWKAIDEEVVARLKKAASSGGRVRLLSGTLHGESQQRLIREFLAGFKGSSHVEYEPLAFDEIHEAQELSYGAPVVPHYRFDQADVVLSLGADFLTGWLSPVEYARTWAARRKLDSKSSATARMSKLYVVESMMSVTGANADERLSVRPGDELKVALAVAHELLVSRRLTRFASDLGVQSALAGYSPEAVAEEVGIEGGAEKIKKMAEELWAARGKSLIVAGGLPGKTKDALALQVAANLLNSALENEGATVDGTVEITEGRGGFADVAKLVNDMKNGAVDVLIIYRSNPAYTLPKALGFEDAVKKVGTVIAVADRQDETARLADFVLPDHHPLENWGDWSPRKGIHSLQQPAMGPIHSTRAFEDGMIAWAKGVAIKGLIARAADWHGYLQANWQESLYRQAGTSTSFELFWEGALRKGVFISKGFGAKSATRHFKSGSTNQIPKYAAQVPGIKLALYAKSSMGDGRSANNAWLQELPDPISSVTWDNYLNIAPATAEKIGVKNDDVVEVSTSDVNVQLPVRVQPGLHASVVAVAIGYGRRNAGKVGDQTGVDVFPFARVNDKSVAYSGQDVKLRKTGRFYNLAATQWTTATMNRPVINDITLAEYRKNPAAHLETDPELRLETVPTMWPEHEYKGYRWGMAIDLNSCTGCSACMIACQAENNVGVVGRDQVRVSRQMHWIRIDRYYSGSKSNPEVVFQPMLCQQCENAPCETVCPVLATMHDDEGLNVQVYNRCVGTRYCQNNCPYKVRRFNFFDLWKSYHGTMNLAWNPDVTVRTRGIMEKCTFCVQRIRDAKDKAKDMGVQVKDGDFKTACQQTCPTDALVFGNINDPESRVSKLREEARAYRVLENLNAKPMISYLTKVRNKERAASHPGSHEA